MKAKIVEGAITIDVEGTPDEIKALLAALRPAPVIFTYPTWPSHPWWGQAYPYYLNWTLTGAAQTVTSGVVDMT